MDPHCSMEPYQLSSGFKGLLCRGCYGEHESHCSDSINKSKWLQRNELGQIYPTINLRGQKETHTETHDYIHTLTRFNKTSPLSGPFNNTHCYTGWFWTGEGLSSDLASQGHIIWNALGAAALWYILFAELTSGSLSCQRPIREYERGQVPSPAAQTHRTFGLAFRALFSS